MLNITLKRTIACEAEPGYARTMLHTQLPQTLGVMQLLQCVAAN